MSIFYFNILYFFKVLKSWKLLKSHYPLKTPQNGQYLVFRSCLNGKFRGHLDQNYEGFDVKI